MRGGGGLGSVASGGSSLALSALGVSTVAAGAAIVGHGASNVAASARDLYAMATQGRSGDEETPSDGATPQPSGSADEYSNFGRAPNPSGEYQGGGLPAHELKRRSCAVDALEIARRLGNEAHIVEILPPEFEPGSGLRAANIGVVRPPAGGQIAHGFPGGHGDPGRSWSNHYFVGFRGRIYDMMTGPSGMSLAEYRKFFEDWNVLDKVRRSPAEVIP